MSAEVQARFPGMIHRSPPLLVLFSLPLWGTACGFGPTPANGEQACSFETNECPDGYDCIAETCWWKGTGPDGGGSDGAKDAAFWESNTSETNTPDIVRADARDVSAPGEAGAS